MKRIEGKIEKIMTAMDRNKEAEYQNENLQRNYAQAATETTTKHIKLAIREERTEVKAIKVTTCNLIGHGLEEWIDETPVEKMRDNGNFVIRSKETLIHCFKASRIGIFTEKR